MTALDAAPAGSGIRCLLQSAAVHPALATDAAPAWLSAAEQAQAQAFTAPARRQEWLLGRWTAKRLVQRCLAERGDAPAGLETLLICTDREGAPYAAQRAGDAEVRLPVSLSISHTDGRAFCALCDGPAAVGADIERIAPREPSFPALFFSAEEQAAVYAAGPVQRDTLITALWSLKEAALKALRLGLLRTDTRRMTCRIPAFIDAPTAWTPLTIALDSALILPAAPCVTTWWRAEAGFVLALARCDHTRASR